MTDTRDKLLEVTIRIFAEAGYHGTTTRRVAQEAGVNEVTLFRHFGSKETLVREALAAAARRSRPMLSADLPDPVAELHRWTLALFYYYYENRQLIRRLMGEMVERQELASAICEDSSQEFLQLVGFFETLRTRGLVRADVVSEAAAGILLNALLTNALWRDVWPDVPNPEENVAGFVELVLKGVGLAGQPAERPALAVVPPARPRAGARGKR
jgi:AcrR family transcriptional regulator